MLLLKNIIHRREIEVKLSGILRFEFASFQFDHHIAAEVQVVEQQINVKIVTAYVEVILIAEERESLSPSSSNSFVTSLTSACSISRSTISGLNGIKSKM